MVSQKTRHQSSPGGSFARHLARLAELYGVQTQYRDSLGRERRPPDETLLRILAALGAKLEAPSGQAFASASALAAAIRARETEWWQILTEPVLVAWEGFLPDMTLRLPARLGRSSGVTVGLTLILEDGSSSRITLPLAGLLPAEETVVEGRSFVAIRVPAGRLRRVVAIAEALSPGYHRLRVEVGELCGEVSVISAPRRCWQTEAGGAGAPDAGGRARVAPDPETSACGGGHEAADAIDAPLRSLAGRRWGMFAPVYGLRSKRDWGAGDLAELGALAEWTGEQGGSLVATLPLLATSFDEDADPSPYRPLSRLFWNEFFLAPEHIEEWSRCEAARLLAGGVEFHARREALRAGDLVDYRAVMALKRPVLEELARCFFSEAGEARRQDFEDYLQENPLALGFAAFRAAVEGAAVPAAGRVLASVTAEQYHLYCQWQMDRQLAGLSGQARPGLLFDLPLGVHPAGFDAQRWPHLFATGVSMGAPPDAFFAGGQDWQTPPVLPDVDRRDGYSYFAACLRNLMRHASVLRVDHMMSFHRLFWIPRGSEPKDGAYITYPAEELYAVLSRESHRSRTAVVGEDLGTVPRGVRASMRRHAVTRTWIFLGSLRPRAKAMIAEVPPGTFVTLETHDMVPLAGFIEGDDIGTRLETGQLDPAGARREWAERQRLVSRLAKLCGVHDGAVARPARTILASCLGWLAGSPAHTIFVNLDDLLLERRPQNVPGTEQGWPNWRRKAAVPLEDLPRPPG